MNQINKQPVCLRYCITNNVKSQSELLSEDSSIPIETLDNCIVVAAEHGHTEMIQLLQKYGANPHCQNWKPVNVAAHNGHVDTVRYLHTQMGNSFGKAAAEIMHSAASSGQLEVIVYLHRVGANLNDCINCVPDLIKDISNLPLLEYFKTQGFATTSPALCVLQDKLNSNDIDIISASDITSFKSTDHFLQSKCLQYCTLNDITSLKAILAAAASSSTEELNISTTTLDNCIVVAAEHGHTEMIQLLQKYGANPHCQNWKPVNVAAHNGHVDTVRYLHTQMGNSFGKAAAEIMHSAASSGQLEVIVYLHRVGANLNDCINCVPDLIKDISNLPLLEYFKTQGFATTSPALCVLQDKLNSNDIDIISASEKTLSAFQLYISRAKHLSNIEEDMISSFDRNWITQEARGMHSWHVMCATGNIIGIFAFFLQPQNLNFRNVSNALLMAAANGQKGAVPILQSLGASIDYENYRAVILAAQGGYLETLKYLHSQLGESFEFPAAAMKAASIYGEFEIVRYLHVNGADLSECELAIPELINKSKNLPLLEYLQQNGTGIGAPNYCVLIDIIGNGDIDGALRLIRSTEPFPSYQQALFEATAKKGSLIVIEALHNNGFDLLKYGVTSLALAAQNRHLDIVTFLIEMGVDYSPIQSEIVNSACSSGNIALLKYLHEMGFSLTNIEPDTLTTAYYDDNLEVFYYATSNGANAISEQLPCIAEMQKEVFSAKEIYHPSKAWEFFNDVHMELLGSSGIINFKQTINQSYFNFIPETLTDPQITRLFMDWLKRPTIIPLKIQLVNPDKFFKNTNLNDSHKVVYKRSDNNSFFKGALAKRIYYKILMGLLWGFVKRHDKLNLWETTSEPIVGNPIQTYYKSKLISQDLAHSIIESNSILEIEKCASTKFTKIAEIGAGYGRLAYSLLKQRNSQFVIFDIPPGLYVSQWYLQLIFPGRKIFPFRHIDNFSEIEEELISSDIAFFTINQIELFPDKYFDLTVNISSLHEMHQRQLLYILNQIYRISSKSVYLKQYHQYQNYWDEIEVSSNSYPVPSDWSVQFMRQDKVDSRFFELAAISDDISAPKKKNSPQKEKTYNASVTVVLANYNHAKYLETSLLALSHQTRPADEVIVVDDGSTDFSVDVIKRFRSKIPNLHLICRKQNSGQHLAIQQAIQRARSDYIVWIASDDIMFPKFIQRSMKEVNLNPGIGLVFSQLSTWIDGTSKSTNYTKHNHGQAFDYGEKPMILNPNELHSLLKKHYLWISGNTVFCKRSALVEMGGFEKSLKWHADWFGYYIVALRYGVVGVPETLCMMRERSDTFSQSGITNKLEQRKVQREILKTIESPKYRDVLPIFKSCPSLLSLFGRDMFYEIIRYPIAWNLLPNRLAYSAANNARRKYGHFIAWKASKKG